MSSGFNGQDDVKELNPRLRLLYIILSISGLVIFSRLWYLQIIQGQELRQYSEQNSVKDNKIPAPRGLILDRKGRVLVENLLGSAAIISPQYANRLKETAEAAAPILEMRAEEIIKIVKKSRRENGPFRAVIIKEDLNMDEVQRISLLRFDHPGLDIKETIVRHYPLKEIGAQLFGYVGEISKRQIERYNKKYASDNLSFVQGDIIGKSGLEEVWETMVRGKDGLSFVEVDARGRISNKDTPDFLDLRQQSSLPGNNLLLTIDRDVQIAAYKAMNRDDKIGPRIGGVVAMKANGEILAWVNSPSYDPNDFSYGISREIWTKLVNDPFKPLRNKVIQDHYSPGSTMKPIVALAALQENVIKPDTLIFSPGLLRFGGRPYHDHSRAGHGHITVVEAIERSSNVFFYKMGIELGIDSMAKYAKALGLGSKTGIRFSNEVPGLFPTTEWKERRFGEPWQPGENLSNAIGQGFVLATPLQLAVAYNAIGREGPVVNPILVKRIFDHENKLIKEFEPSLVRDISGANDSGVVISSENFKVVKEGMRRVGNGQRGTARWWKIPGVEIAGKTGTSQVRSYSADEIYSKCQDRPIQQRHHGLFVGFAPAKDPKIVVAALTEHSCAGSSGGAPVVRDVIESYIKNYHPELLETKKTAGVSQ